MKQPHYDSLKPCCEGICDVTFNSRNFGQPCFDRTSSPTYLIKNAFEVNVKRNFKNLDSIIGFVLSANYSIEIVLYVVCRSLLTVDYSLLIVHIWIGIGFFKVHSSCVDFCQSIYLFQN